MGFPDVGQKDPQQQAYRQAHCRTPEVATRVFKQLRENIRGAVILRMKSRSDASDTDKPYSRTPVSGSERREAVEQACSEASGFEAGSQSRGKSGGGRQEA